MPRWLKYLFIIVLLIVSFQIKVWGNEFHFVTLPYPPLEFEANDGHAHGIAVDIVRRAMGNLGHHVTIRVLPWARAIKMVRLGNADAIFTIFKNPEREKFLDFSSEVLLPQVIYFYKKKGSDVQFDGNISSIQGKRIGVVSTISYGQVFESYKPLVFLDRVERLEQNLIKLLKGRIDLLPSSYDVAEYTINNLGLSSQIVRIPYRIERLPSYIAYSKVRNLGTLRIQLDNEIVNMKNNGQYDAIIRSYGRHSSD